MNREERRVHPFERAGMGSAPFRCTGCERKVYRAAPDAPAQPGGTCDYCGTGIMDCYRVRSSDGKVFVVGSDCVNRVYTEFDAEIPADFRAEFLRIEREKREVRREAAHGRLVARVKAASELLEAQSWLFCGEKHPNARYASQGKTYRDYMEFMLTSAGDSGRTSACKTIEHCYAVASENDVEGAA